MAKCQAICPGSIITALAGGSGVGGNLERKISHIEQEMQNLHREICKVKNTGGGMGGGPGKVCCQCGNALGAGAGSDSGAAGKMASDIKAELEKLREANRELADEHDDCKTTVQELTEQVEDYRTKFLAAQQAVEEQRRQIDCLERDNSRISEQVNQELQRVKKLFQDKLEELSPLPFILETTQLKCQEACAEKARLEGCMDKLRGDLENWQGRAKSCESQLTEAQSQIVQLTDDNETLNENVAALNAVIAANKEALDAVQGGGSEAADKIKELEGQLEEMQQMGAQMDTIREESARQVMRLKERSQSQKKLLQDRVFSLEKDLAICRAAARAAISDRDEVRQRMQCQINVLCEHFEEAQQEIEVLRGHVTVLKTSYTNILETGGPNDVPLCNCQRNL